MSKTNIKQPIFLTYEELIKKLENRGLKILEKDKLIWYISTYNYQNIINNFNEPFYQNKGFRSKKYLEYSNSQMIIDFFNFNRSISSIIINDLHTIEMRLSSAISYEIMNITKYPYFNEKYMNTIFDSTDDDEFNYLNTNLNQILEQRKKNNLKDWTKIPLYDLSLIWTFGISVQFFNKLKNTIQKTILEKYFSKIKNIELDTFKYLLFSFVSLRNKISHNEVIYNFKCEDNKNIFKICNKNDKRIKQKIKKKIERDFSKLLNKQLCINLNILYLIRIIGLINNNKKLEEIILDKIKELKNSIYKGKRKENETSQQRYYPCKEAWENICNFLGCKDNINIDDD